MHQQESALRDSSGRQMRSALVRSAGAATDGRDERHDDDSGDFVCVLISASYDTVRLCMSVHAALKETMDSSTKCFSHRSLGSIRGEMGVAHQSFDDCRECHSHYNGHSQVNLQQAHRGCFRHLLCRLLVPRSYGFRTVNA
jgi:hypothetical protein